MPYLPKATNLTDSSIEAQSDKRPNLGKGEDPPEGGRDHGRVVDK